MLSRFLIFLVIAQAIVFACHVPVYFFLVRAFAVTSPAARWILAGVFVILGSSFLAASFLSRWHDDLFTRVFYYLAALWLGTVLYLFLASAFSFVVRAFLHLMRFQNADRVVVFACLVAAIGYSLYGVWNAARPRVRAIDVGIPRLPESWKGKTVVQLSDLHLGTIHRSAFLKRAVETVKGLHPDMVVITGDLLDGSDGDLDALVAPLVELRAPQGVFFITGNHETYLGIDRVYPVVRRTGVRILDDELVDCEGLQLVGVSYPLRGRSKNVAETMRSIPAFDPGKATLLLFHSPVQIRELRQSMLGLQLSGHTHDGQLYPIKYISRWVYHGFENGLHREGDYTLYTSSGTGTWGPPMRTGNRPEIVQVRFH
jgi:predicted MPP superfamily phosphohydrolase